MSVACRFLPSGGPIAGLAVGCDRPSFPLRECRRQCPGTRSYAYADKYGNCWPYDMSLLKSCLFLTALKMRSGTTSDRVTLNKAIPQATIKCRKCTDGFETLAHIFGQCTHENEDTKVQ